MELRNQEEENWASPAEQAGETQADHSRQLKNEIWLRGYKTMHAIVSILLFAACWQLFYREGQPMQEGILLLVVYGVSNVLFGRIYNAYYIGLTRTTEVIYSLTLAGTLSLCLTYGAMAIASWRFPNPLPMAGLLAVQVIWNIGWSTAGDRLHSRLNPAKRAAVIYREESDLKKISGIGELSKRFRMESYIRDPENIHEAIEKLRGYEAVFVAGVPATMRNGIVKYCVEQGVEGYVLPHVGDVILSGAEHMQMFSVPVLRIRRAEQTPEYRFVKRAADMGIAGLALVILSPIMLITAAAIRLYDGGPALYRQKRLTKDGRVFEILKFRSMIQAAEKDGVARLASAHDSRITPVGKIIRACRIDELPQLINIVKGDMSIVGPRPERPEIAAQYEEEIPAFALRLQVKAGLTGLAQIYGRYNTTPHDKLQMDLMYINRMSVMEDLRLMFATVKVLFQKESTSGIGDGAVTALEQKNNRGGVHRSISFRGNLIPAAGRPVPAAAAEGWR